METNRKPRLLAVCGSLRKESSNRKLLAVAVAGARAAGADVRELDLLDFPMAAYNEDDHLRDGMPETAQRMRQLFFDHDGALFAVPEYNNSLPGGFKNVLDWASRKDDRGSCFDGKFAAIMGASGSGGGARRCLAEMRNILHMLGMHVIPEQFSLPNGRKAFDASGRMIDAEGQEEAAAVGARLAEVIRRLAF
jgi:chromate reductase